MYEDRYYNKKRNVIFTQTHNDDRGRRARAHLDRVIHLLSFSKKIFTGYYACHKHCWNSNFKSCATNKFNSIFDATHHHGQLQSSNGVYKCVKNQPFECEKWKRNVQ